MNHKNMIILGGLFGILAIFVFVSYIYFVPAPREEEKDEISVIVYESGADRWASFRQGMEQAAKDYRAVIHFIEITGADDTKEEKAMIQREKEQGADGIVAALTDTGTNSDYLLEIANSTPVVLVESAMENSSLLTDVSADSYEMGQELAAFSLEGMTDPEITILQTEDRKLAQNMRMQGFLKYCEENKIEAQTLQEMDGKMIRQFKMKKRQQIFVAFNDLDMENLIALLENIDSDIRLFGIGNSRRIVYAMEQGIVSGILFQNEFNMGYEAINTLVQQIRKGKSEIPEKIAYHKVRTENLHMAENERLLYPITQ